MPISERTSAFNMRAEGFRVALSRCLPLLPLLSAVSCDWEWKMNKVYLVGEKERMKNGQSSDMVEFPAVK
jgi:hypothetical protein